MQSTWELCAKKKEKKKSVQGIRGGEISVPETVSSSRKMQDIPSPLDARFPSRSYGQTLTEKRLLFYTPLLHQ